MTAVDKNASNRALADERVTKLVSLIEESFRVRRNQDPIYVDVAGNLTRVGSKQHQVIFGRRGSGKSCLLIHFLNTSERTSGPRCIYIQADEFKRLTYPDVLIRLLMELLSAAPTRMRRLRRVLRIPHPADKHAQELRRLLDSADEADVVSRQTRERSESVKAGIAAAGVGTGEAQSGSKHVDDHTASFRARKLDTVERHLKDYKQALIRVAAEHDATHLCVIVDDFYLLAPDSQPDVLDYLHRLLRDTDLYMKVATVRHRTTLLRNHPQTVGVELSQDVQPIDLDRTLEDLASTKSFLGEMLDSLGRKVGLEKATEELFNPEALEALTLASGGVPRDLLTIFTHAVQAARNTNSLRWLTPTLVYRGAAAMAWQTKLSAMRDDVSGDAAGLERLLTDLVSFCLVENRKTAFLIAQDEAGRMPDAFERIQQLMDFKLIHIVEPDTSAASGRVGRYAAYTLDFSFFMHPRRRKIELVEFWKTDEGRRRLGIREAPIYSLERARAVADDSSKPTDPENVLPPEGTDDEEE